MRNVSGLILGTNKFFFQFYQNFSFPPLLCFHYKFYTYVNAGKRRNWGALRPAGGLCHGPAAGSPAGLTLRPWRHKRACELLPRSAFAENAADVIVAVAPEVPPVTVSFDWKVPDLPTM